MKILLLNQCFYPDVVSTAQHLTDLALGLSTEGHDVTVIASSRGYDDPRRRFARREKWRGVTIRRIGCTGFGKKSRWRRAVDFGSFMLNCAVRVLLLPRFDLVVAMTSPPLISFLAALLVKLKGGRFALWVMDLNPDEAIAAGWLRKQSAVARLLHAFMQYSLKRADRIIVLDRFIKHRIISRGIDEEKIVVLPPWSHDDVIRYDHEGRTKFRALHNLSDKCVVMYSGNHSPCHPLDTLLGAAQALAGNDKIVFCFVGGGSEMEKVKTSVAANKLNNVLCLGYQPLDELAGSLSAADLHVVVMGDPFVGIVHPCKIYNILQIGAPVLYIGPADSHVSDIFSGFAERYVTFSASHGDVDLVVRQIVTAAATRNQEAKARIPGQAAFAFSKEAILPRLIAALCAPLDAQVAYGSRLTESEGHRIQERTY